MTIDRFEVQGLAQYSYIISSQGRSVVIDPIRDTDRYLHFLEERGLTLSSIVETHIHADFASGAKALAESTGAELALSGYDEGEHYRYGMPHRSLRTGDSVSVGTVRENWRVVATAQGREREGHQVKEVRNDTEDAMNIGEFWSIIEKSREKWDTNHPDGNQDRQLKALEKLLSHLPSDEVVSFERHFQELFYRAYRWDLWHAAFIVADGCSDDSFMDFRAWLISMGQSNYEAAFADVETVAQIAAVPGVEYVFFEGFSSVAGEVYEKQTGKELRLYLTHPAEPAGHRVPETEFPTRFPRLWQRSRKA